MTKHPDDMAPRRNTQIKQYLSLFLDRPLAVHRIFGKITGSLSAGVLLSQAYYWCDKGSDPEWFWKTQAEWQEETLLSRREQETARRSLLLLRSPDGVPVWEEQRRGQPARLYFRLNLDALAEVIEAYLNGEKRQSSMAESANLEWLNAPIQNGEKRQSLHRIQPENTTENNPNSVFGVSSQTANGAGQVDAAEPATVAKVDHARPTRAIAGSTDHALVGGSGLVTHDRTIHVGDPLQGAVSQDSPQDIDARVAELLDAADDPAGVAQDPQQLADIQAYHQQLADTVSRGRSGLAPDASNEFTHSWLAIISTTPPAAGSLQTAGTVSRQVPGTGNVPKVAPAPPQAPTGRRNGYSGMDTPYVAPQAPRKAGKGAGKQEKW